MNNTHELITNNASLLNKANIPLLQLWEKEVA